MPQPALVTGARPGFGPCMVMVLAAQRRTSR
jgi:hypothetical protein